MSIHSVILAAGQGTRMKSRHPKVLQPLAGRPLLAHVLEVAEELSDKVHVVFGHGGDAVPAAFPDADVNWVTQAEQLGTGHAVQQAIPSVPDGALVLVLYGDVPLITASTLSRLIEAAAESKVALLTVELDDPAGYGRIVRNPDGDVTAIVEERDADDRQRAIREVNTGVMCLDAGSLRGWLDALDNGNSQGEYYLTDIIGIAVASGVSVRTVSAASVEEVLGVNDRLQLATLERHYQLAQATELARQGLMLADPARFDLRGSLSFGVDVRIDVNVILEGSVDLADGVEIGAGSLLRNVSIGADTVVQPYSVLDSCNVADDCQIGPFARLRPGTRMATGSKIGNFVETKAAVVGESSKINHLSYIGDAVVGRNVNVGAGVITCNYDGANKHRTTIEDDAFIGSDSQLVAPVVVGEGATVGAGTTLTRDAPAGQLTVSRARQSSLKGWKRPSKKSAGNIDAGHPGTDDAHKNNKDDH